MAGKIDLIEKNEMWGLEKGVDNYVYKVGEVYDSWHENKYFYQLAFGSLI